MSGPFLVRHVQPDTPRRAYTVLSVKAVEGIETARQACISIAQPYAAREVRESEFPGGPVAAISLKLLSLDWAGEGFDLPDGSQVVVEARDRNRMLDEAGVELASIKTTADDAEVCAIWNSRFGVDAQSEGVR